MKNIRILHLYSNALDLYGDYKNLTVLCQRIAETGNTAEVTEVRPSSTLRIARWTIRSG